MQLTQQLSYVGAYPHTQTSLFWEASQEKLMNIQSATPAKSIILVECADLTSDQRMALLALQFLTTFALIIAAAYFLPMEVPDWGKKKSLLLQKEADNPVNPD